MILAAELDEAVEAIAKARIGGAEQRREQHKIIGDIASSLAELVDRAAQGQKRSQVVPSRAAAAGPGSEPAVALALSRKAMVAGAAGAAAAKSRPLSPRPARGLATASVPLLQTRRTPDETKAIELTL